MENRLRTIIQAPHNANGGRVVRLTKINADNVSFIELALRSNADKTLESRGEEG